MPLSVEEQRLRWRLKAARMRERKREAGIPLTKTKPETLKAYREKNREKLRAYQNAWNIKKRRDAGIGPRPPAAGPQTPDEWREYQKQWRLKNPGKAADYSRKWRDENLEVRSAYQGKYNQENRELLRLKQENRRRARGVKPMKRGKMSRLEEGRLYRERHPEKVREKERRYRKNNPEAYRQKARIDTGRRRIRKANLPGSHTKEEWLAVCEKFENRCVGCGIHNSASTLARDHIIPISKPGSTDDISNIQPLCQSCNSKKGNRHTIDYRETPFINAKMVAE